MITTVSEEFYETLSPKPKLSSLTDFNLSIQGAGGNNLPYSGYIEAVIQVPFIEGTDIDVPVLVVPTTEFNLKVPVVIGTNVIKQCRNMCTQETEIPDEWKDAFISLQKGRVGVVKSTNKYNIKIQPNETVTLSGLVRKNKKVETAVTEATEGASSRVGVCPRVVNINSPGKSQRIAVRLFNISAKVIEIAPKSSLCELHEVTVLRNMDISEHKEGSSHIHQQRAEKLNSKEVFEEIDLVGNDLTKEQREKLKDFLNKWKGIFSTGITDLGNCDLLKHKINLSDNVPFKEPHRRIPPALFQEVREHLAEMLKAGTIRPSHSPYSSNIVIVRKKDGTIRFCVDFRKLNSKTIKDAYAIPRIEDSLHLLAGSKYFTKLDLRSGYWQVEIDESDKEKTAFQVGTLGFFEFHRMPFGLCNAPATFQRLMERCMGDMNLRECLIYLDDVIIFSSTFEEHLDCMEAVFSRLQQHNLKLKASKCEFLKSRVTYLGHIVSEFGIETDPDKIQAIKMWPIPKSTKDVRSFLGFTGYYRRFIKDFASIARPLNDLLVGHGTTKKAKKKQQKPKKVPFVWTEKQQEAFETLQEKLTNPPILAYADYRLPFKLHTDASSTGLGAVLYQHQDGHDRVIAYASRSLKPSEKNYPAHKLEFLALKWSITEKFHDYLYGANFEVLTDNNPLTYVFTTAKLDATGHRWLAELANYNFNIKYRSGKTNIDADGLSREFEENENAIITVFPDVIKPICQTVVAEKDDVPFVESLSLTDTKAESQISDDLLSGTALTSRDWKKAQATDVNLKFLLDNIHEGYKPSGQDAEKNGVDQAFLTDWDTYTVKDGVLYKRHFVNGEECNQLVLPDKLKETIFSAYHDDLGHQGRDRTTALIKQRFFWPRMNQFIKERIQKCGRCIRRKTTPGKAATLVNIKSTTPMELVCIDYLSLERSKGGFENILVITDHFSRFAQAIPTRNQTATTTAKALYENFFLHYGFPAKLHSDKGANFESKVIKKLCGIAGVLKTRTTPYHPMGNGMVERFNQTLLNMMGTLNEKQKGDWKSFVPSLTHAYNAAVHESTGFSPFYLMFGRHPRLAIDAFLGIGSTEERKSHQDYVDRLKDRLQFAYDQAGQEAKRKGRKYKKYYDEGVKTSVLLPGDRVLVRKVGIKGKQKLADIWDSWPYIVKSQPMPDIPVYVVQKEHSNEKPRTLHRNMLLPFNGLPNPEYVEKPKQKSPPAPEQTSYRYSSSSGSSSEDSSDNELPAVEKKLPRYVIPARRQPSNTASLSSSNITQQQPVLRRCQRRRNRPTWMKSSEWLLGSRQHTTNAQPEDVVYI